MASETSDFTRIHSLPTGGSLAGFADALSIWINKPHVVNRRLCGSKIISIDTHSNTDFEVQQVLDKLRQLGYELTYISNFCHDKNVRQEDGQENVMDSSEAPKHGDTSSEKRQNQDDRESSNNCEISEGHDNMKDISEDDRRDSDNAGKTEPSNNPERHTREDITQVEGLADYEEDVVVLIVRELVPKQPDRHKNIPELIIYGLWLLFFFSFK